MRKLSVIVIFCFVEVVAFAHPDHKARSLSGPTRAGLVRHFADSGGDNNALQPLPSVRPYSYQPLAVPKNLRSLATYGIIDSVRPLGFMMFNTHSLAYDPDLNILTSTYQGGPYAGVHSSDRRAVYFSLSEDGGVTWRRSSIPLNNSDPRCGASSCFGSYWVGGSIFSPTGDTVHANAWGSGGHFNLNESNSGAYEEYICSPIMDLLSGPASVPSQPSARSWFDYTQGVVNWTSKTTMFAAALKNIDQEGTTTRGIELVRATSDPWTYTQVIPPTWDSTAWYYPVVLGGDHIQVGGTSVNVLGAYGAYYTSYDSEWVKVLGVSTSTDEGATWSAWDTIRPADIPELNPYTEVRQIDGSINSMSGSILLDSAGNPHFFVPLGDNIFASIGEIYKESGSWKGKLIGSLNPSTHFNYQATSQMNGKVDAARNKEGTVFAVHYVNSEESGKADLYVSGRTLSARFWKPPVNITNTPYYNESVPHCAPRLRHDGGNLYTLWSSYLLADEDKTNLDYGKGYQVVGAYQLDVTPSGFSDSSLVLPCDLGFHPPSGFITPDSIVHFHFCFKNVGLTTQTDSLRFNFKIFNSLSQVLYAESLHVCCLTPGEERAYNLLDFTPPGLGRFRTLETFPGTNDSAEESFSVVTPAPITQSNVYKLENPYNEIPITVDRVAGDDSSYRTRLPFSFTYDGVVYDSISYSTNGWVTLGALTGTNPHLLLHRAEGNHLSLGAEDNTGILSTYTGSANGLNKVFGAWWDDMATRAIHPGVEDSGHVGDTLLGTAPYRVFVMQWKNIGANSEDVSTRLNFQVRLYEGINMIEFGYGHVDPHTFVAPVDGGASIVASDTLNGPYHYYDFYRHGYGNQLFLRTDLNPLTDWPGENTCYRFHASSPIMVALTPRWNLVSTPTGGINIPVPQVFPSALSSTTYLYNSGYQPAVALNQGRGYWMKFPLGQGSASIMGALSFVDDTVTTGWNLVGAPDHDIPAPIGAVVIGPDGPAGTTGLVYEYSNGYRSVTTMHPGKGYWVKTNASGILRLGFATIAPNLAKGNLETYSSITIKNKAGNSQTLYFKETEEKDTGMNQYEMPPVPPSGIFDARFASGRILEAYPASIKDHVEYGLSLHSLQYPVQVTWNIRSARGKVFALLEKDGDNVIRMHTLGASGSCSLTNSAPYLSLRVSTGALIPEQFSLQQNYPNPFNPTTTIEYALPSKGFVTLRIYDLLGRAVKTLVNEIQEEGNRSVAFDASNLASGMYLYELRAGGFTAVRKLVVMK